MKLLAIDPLARDIGIRSDYFHGRGNQTVATQVMRDSIMETVLGTFRDGQVVLDREVDWPNGASLEIRLGISGPFASSPNQKERCFDGSCPPSTSTEIEEWLKWFDTIEPFDWSDAERSRFEQALRESDEISKADLLKQWSFDGAAS